MRTISADMEWTSRGIDVLGMAWDDGRKATATERTDDTMEQFLELMRRADRVAMHNGLDADCRKLAQEGIETGWLERKTFDTRLAFHACFGHLAGTGSFDLRSVVMLLNGRQGERFPLDWKKYEFDLHATCAFDAASTAWIVPTLDRLIATNKLEGIVKTAHRAQPIFSRMGSQGVRLDQGVLNHIHQERKVKLAANIDKYGLWEERGKKVIKRVPIWRSPKVLDLFESKYGVRPANLQRTTWQKLTQDARLSDDAREFATVMVDLGKGANDAHWLGKAVESDDGIDFEKVSADGFIFPRYDLCGTPDRAATSSPSIQNWPRVSDDPRAVPIRSAVLPLQEGHVILDIDFGSVETYTNAIESNDWDRVRAVQAGRVSHQGTADLLNKAFGLSLTRNDGKATNHSWDKGESPYNLARRMFKTERPSRQQSLQCQNIFEQMLKEYPLTAKFRDDLWERSRENPLIVTTRFGRQLRCFSRAKYGESNDRFAKHNPAKKYWCSCTECSPRRDRWKYAIAFLGRAAAFDALLQKMIVVWEERRLDEFSLPMIECHDELAFSVPAEKAEHYAKILKATFEEPVPELDGISLPAAYQIGPNWAAAH